MSHIDTKELARQTLIECYKLQDNTNAELLDAQKKLNTARESGNDATIEAANYVFSQAMKNSSKVMSSIFKARNAYEDLVRVSVSVAK